MRAQTYTGAGFFLLTANTSSALAFSLSCGNGRSFPISKSSWAIRSTTDDRAETETVANRIPTIEDLDPVVDNDYEDGDNSSVSLEYANRALFQKIARNADDVVSVPLVPKMITRYYLEEFLSQIQLQPKTWQRFNAMWSAEKTKTKADDFTVEQVQTSADSV